jgi:hypothetical protein
VRKEEEIGAKKKYKEEIGAKLLNKRHFDSKNK